MHRFKMSFNNSGYVPPQYNNSFSSVNSKPLSVATSKNSQLNAPMIDRVHKARPGCSACGKKVA